MFPEHVATTLGKASAFSMLGRRLPRPSQDRQGLHRAPPFSVDLLARDPGGVEEQSRRDLQETATVLALCRGAKEAELRRRGKRVPQPPASRMGRLPRPCHGWLGLRQDPTSLSLFHTATIHACTAIPYFF
jgi:hypothetical protein